jgi:peptide/nickel transport system permease protein
LPATIELTMVSQMLVLAFGIPLGILAATNRNKLGDHFARFVALSGGASPSFLVALIIQLVFFYYLTLFQDSGGRISIFVERPTQISGLLTVDSLVTWNISALRSTIEHLIMPAFALAFLTLGLMSRLVRASLLEALASDYVKTAKAKGLKRRTIIYKHALRNALLQPITALSIFIAYLLGGSVVIELIFSWPGIGRYAAQAALEFDLPAVMGTTIVFTIIVITVNVIADIICAVLDPRIRIR